MAAVDDPHVLDRRLRQQIDHHLAILATRPPDPTAPAHRRQTRPCCSGGAPRRVRRCPRPTVSAARRARSPHPTDPPRQNRPGAPRRRPSERCAARRRSERRHRPSSARTSAHSSRLRQAASGGTRPTGGGQAPSTISVASWPTTGPRPSSPVPEPTTPSPTASPGSVSPTQAPPTPADALPSAPTPSSANCTASKTTGRSSPPPSTARSTSASWTSPNAPPPGTENTSAAHPGQPQDETSGSPTPTASKARSTLPSTIPRQYLVWLSRGASTFGPSMAGKSSWR